MPHRCHHPGALWRRVTFGAAFAGFLRRAFIHSAASIDSVDHTYASNAFSVYRAAQCPQSSVASLLQNRGAFVSENKPASSKGRPFPVANTYCPKVASPRKAILSLYPSRVQYPPRPWTFVLIAILIASWGIQSVLTSHIPETVADKLVEFRGPLLAAFGPRAAAAYKAFAKSIGWTGSAAAPSASACLLLLLLLGRHVEGTVGSFVVIAYVAGAMLQFPVAILCQTMAPATCMLATSSLADVGCAHLSGLGAVFLLFAYTCNFVRVTSVLQGEPLSGCTTISFWVNRWRMFRVLAIGQFIALLLLAQGDGHAVQPFSVFVIAAMLGGATAWAPWKFFVDRKKPKHDLKEEGTKVLDFVDGWVDQQEQTASLALQAAEAAASVVGTTKKKKEAEDMKELVGMAKQGLAWFQGARKLVRDKLDEGLEALASDSDENPRIAATSILCFANVLAYLCATFYPSVGLALNLPETRGAGMVVHVACLRRAGAALVHNSVASLSAGVLLLVLAGRAIELECGTLCFGVGYLLCGALTGLCCNVLGVSAPMGLAAWGSLVGMMMLAFNATLSQAFHLRRPLETLKSWRKVRHSASKVDRGRLLEAALFVQFVLVWLRFVLPGSIAAPAPVPRGAFWAVRGVAQQPPHEVLWNRLPSEIPLCAIAIFGGTLGASICCLLLFPLLGFISNGFRRIARLLPKSKKEAKGNALQARSKGLRKRSEESDTSSISPENGEAPTRESAD